MRQFFYLGEKKVYLKLKVICGNENSVEKLILGEIWILTCKFLNISNYCILIFEIREWKVN